MSGHYVVVPAHTVRHLSGHGSTSKATEAATAMVEKDRAPRVVVQVVAEVTASVTPRVEVTRRKEVVHGAA